MILRTHFLIIAATDIWIRGNDEAICDVVQVGQSESDRLDNDESYGLTMMNVTGLDNDDSPRA